MGVGLEDPPDRFASRGAQGPAERGQGELGQGVGGVAAKDATRTFNLHAGPCADRVGRAPNRKKGGPRAQRFERIDHTPREVRTRGGPNWRARRSDNCFATSPAKSSECAAA